MARVLTDCLPQPGKPVWLYLLEHHLCTELPEEHNRRSRVLHRPEQYARGFGLLSTTQLPRVPEFPLFTRSGEERVTLRQATTPLYLNTDQIERLIRFHRLLFHRVLRVEREAVMQLVPERAYCQMLLAPVFYDEQLVDWDFVDDVEASSLLHTPCKIPPRMDANQKFVFRDEDFLDAVVNIGIWSKVRDIGMQVC